MPSCRDAWVAPTLFSGRNVDANPNRLPDPSTLTVSAFVDYEPAPAGRIVIVAARNETAAFELRLRPQRAIVGLNIRCAPLVHDWNGSGDSNESDATTLNADCSRLHPVRLDRWPGWHIRYIEPADRVPNVYDVAVPIDAPVGGLPDNALAGQEFRVLGEFAIPHDAAPGTYAGRIEFLAAADRLGSMPIELHVLSVTIPADRPVNARVDLDIRSIIRHLTPANAIQDAQTGAESEAGRALANAVRLLESHRVTPVLSGFMPAIKLDRDGQLSADWSDFDALVGPFIDPHGPAALRSEFALHWDDMVDRTTSPLPTGGDPVESAAIGLVNAFAEHFAARGWIETLTLELPTVRSPDEFEHLVALARPLRDLDPRVRVGSDTSWHETPANFAAALDQRGVSEIIDVWSPPARFCDPHLRRAGLVIAMRLDQPPYTGTLDVRAPPAFTRVIPWQALRYDVTTLYAGSAVHWPPAGKRASPQDCAEFDPANLLYPGRPFGLDRPLASRRLKTLRRGVEDVALAEPLLRSDRVSAVNSLLNALSSYAFTDACRHHLDDPRPCAWPFDNTLWTLARRLLLDNSSIAAHAGTPADDSPSLQRNLRWLGLQTMTDFIELTAESVQLRPTRDPGIHRVECTVRIENRSAIPVSGTVAFTDLPLGWSAVEPSSDVSPISTKQNPGRKSGAESPNASSIVGPVDPGQFRRVTLLADAPSLARNANGVIRLAVVFDRTGGSSIREHIRLAIVAARPIQSPIVLDADLADWTTGGNTAGDFLSIAHRSRRATDPLPPPVASDDTQCYVACDDSRIYFGFRCSTNAPPPNAAVRRNDVRYADGIPADGDLVEILIDPERIGTHTPNDVYYAVVRRDGTAVFTRGVARDGSDYRTWNADIRYAVGERDGAWIAEIGIPRDAFLQPDPRAVIWGLNLTRFDAQSQTYTSWSGAAFNAHDPASFGHLMLPLR
ncbi:MAG: hypothetical protein HOP29_01220 [Phycisphaerales bacterium]|nr:hypothetical protein [Phycisphaerales bacterium]